MLKLKNEKINLTSWVEIERNSLLKNIQSIKSLLNPETEFMAVVKSNAYGHGLVEVSEIIQSFVDWFGVNSFEEAEKINSKKPILILGFTSPDLLHHVIEKGFRQVVYDLEILRKLEVLASKLHRKVSIHLKIETGTNRLGVKLEDLDRFTKVLKRSENVILEGLYSHLADAEKGPKDNFTKTQLGKLNEAISLLQQRGFKVPLSHIGASAATLLNQDTHLDLVRVGISLYGLWPSKETEQSSDIELLPVLSWKTRVAQLKLIRKNETIGYGRIFRAKNDMRVAILPIGYFEGYDRKLSNKGYVLISGKPAKVVGRVCMNMTMVDVTNIGNVKMGDEVILIGRQGQNTVTVEELAQITETINYEVVSRINPNLPRVVV